MESERVRVLLVDDEKILLDLVSEVLEECGYAVSAFNSGSDALNAFLSKPSGFDIVVADEKMPDLSGSDLAEEILGARPDIPIVLYTDYPEAPSTGKARTIGVRKILQKSSRTEELVACIRRLMES
jgi:two-component system, cell cycle sensor histidine kinase and response regulator CckA